MLKLIYNLHMHTYSTTNLKKITLRGSWCDIIVLNVHALTEDKTDYLKESLYENLEHVFDQFPKHHIKIVLGEFNTKEGREDSFKTNNWEWEFTWN